MLNLASATDPSWVERALASMDEILVDHAHCEKKAASTAINLLFRYPDREPLQVPLARLAREELAHFEQVLDHIRRRGGTYGRMTPSPYAALLMQAVRPEEPLRLMDTLLCCALIEARSCERMQLLAEQMPDPSLRAFYEGLLASEARHHNEYVEMARELAIVPDAQVRERLRELAAHEARVIAAIEPEARFHS